MDQEGAGGVLAAELEPPRAQTYKELAATIGELRAYEVPNPNGHPYQVEVQVVWDAQPGGAIRVLGGHR